MSNKVLVSVYDKVAGLYSPVMTEVNTDSAIRNFKLGAKQNAQISACPQDYELHLICSSVLRKTKPVSSSIEQIKCNS